MAYVITDECVACGTCAEACPAEAQRSEPAAGGLGGQALCGPGAALP